MSFYTKGQTGYVGVMDVTKIMIQLMNSKVNGERFSIVSENCSYRNILISVAKNLKMKKPYIHVKPWLTNIYWRIDWFFGAFLRTKRLLSKHAATSLHSIKNYSNSKIKNALNFEFQSIDTVIKEIVVLQKK